MKFDKSKVYTALNADELKIGSKVIVANYLESLENQVEANSYPSYIVELSQIMGTSSTNRFNVNGETFNLAYLISEPEPNWIVYVCRREGVGPYLTCCRSDVWKSVNEKGAKTKLFEGPEDECMRWYTSRRHLTDVMVAWEDGKTIQFNSGYGWNDCCDNIPAWDVTVECDTTSGWVRVTDKEHLVKAIETDCILRVVPSDSVNALDISLALSGMKK